MSDLQLPLNLFPDKMELVNRLNELDAHSLVVFFRELPVLILAKVIPVETVLERERMGNVELLPGDNSACTDLVGLNLEATVLDVEQMGLLGEDAG